MKTLRKKKKLLVKSNFFFSFNCKMSSAICLNLDQSNILPSGNGLSVRIIRERTGPTKNCIAMIYRHSKTRKFAVFEFDLFNILSHIPDFKRAQEKKQLKVLVPEDHFFRSCNLGYFRSTKKNHSRYFRIDW